NFLRKPPATRARRHSRCWLSGDISPGSSLERALEYMLADRSGLANYLAGGAEAAGAAAASGLAAFCPPLRRSSTDWTASRVVRSFSASSSGAVTVERLIRLSASG